MPASLSRPGRRKPKQTAQTRQGSLIVPEHTSRPEPSEAPPEKETVLEESIRKMLEAAYT